MKQIHGPSHASRHPQQHPHDAPYRSPSASSMVSSACSATPSMPSLVTGSSEEATSPTSTADTTVSGMNTTNTAALDGSTAAWSTSDRMNNDPTKTLITSDAPFSPTSQQHLVCRSAPLPPLPQTFAAVSGPLAQPFLPQDTTVPREFPALRFPSLDPITALGAAEAARLLATNPSWEMYAHLPGNMIEETISPPESYANQSPPHPETPSTPNEPEQNGLKKRKRRLSKITAASYPVGSSPAPSRMSRSPKRRSISPSNIPYQPLGPSSAALVAERPCCGCTKWVPPTVTGLRHVNGEVVRHTLKSNQLPPHVGQTLVQLRLVSPEEPTSRSDAKRGDLLPTEEAGSGKSIYGSQPHLDRLREQVLSGQRPDLVTLYLDKLQPKKSALTKRVAQADNKMSDASSSTALPKLSGPPMRLSQAEKKANHLAAEHRRRTNIRRGYQNLVSLVPSLKHLARDEIKVGMAIEGRYLYDSKF